MIALPIDSHVPAIVQAVLARNSLVLAAPPGSGKTTRVPRALAEAGLNGDVVVLEPRRLAARLAAERVADEWGEKPGGRVGYQMRHDTVASERTVVRFVTEGVLTRRLLGDPTLRGTACVVLDEVHERNLQGDLALALLARLRKTTRPDLRIVAMSATLEAKAFADFLGCDTYEAEGRRFDVVLEHLDAPDERPLEDQVTGAVRRLVREEATGHVLVFLPGAREIRRCQESLGPLAASAGFEILPLHGDLPVEEQRRAVAEGRGRKVILSTNVAESSVTIDGVVGVVDSGLARTVDHAPWSGLSEMRLAKVSQASCIQRAGRAGRTREGRALRLYTKGDFDRRPAHDLPEIQRADLTSTVLELRASGIDDLTFLDRPRDDAWVSAVELLRRLDALDHEGRVTDTGRSMLRLPLHPRLARIVVEGRRRGVGDDAAVAAALLEERDLRVATRTRFDARGGGYDGAAERSDVGHLLGLFREVEASGFNSSAARAAGVDLFRAKNVARAAKRIAQTGDDRRSDEDPHDPESELLRAILRGFPDRVARRTRAQGRELQLAGGMRAELAETSHVRHEEWLVAVSADVQANRAVVVRLASGVDRDWLLDLDDTRLEERVEATFLPGPERVEAMVKILYDGLVLDASLAPKQGGPVVQDALLRAAMERGGPRAFAEEGALDRFLGRARFAKEQDATIEAPDDEAVVDILRELCDGLRTLAELRNAGLLPHVVQATPGSERLASIAPERVTLTSGKIAPVTYEPGKPPWLESFLQDFFGTKKSPTAGRVPIVLHLLAPNRRAVQVTTDLPGFWDRHYPAIRKELMRKYPRHAWPEDPTVFVPTKNGRPAR